MKAAMAQFVEKSGGPIGVAIAIAIGFGAIYFLLGKVGEVAGAAVDAVKNVNEGTDYEGAGAVGTLGNAANQLSGGVLADFGSWLGGKVFDMTHDEYDPNQLLYASTDTYKPRAVAVKEEAAWYESVLGRPLQ